MASVRIHLLLATLGCGAGCALIGDLDRFEVVGEGGGGQGAGSCEPTQEAEDVATCGDSLDNDCDGVTDCGDPDCISIDCAALGYTCGDGIPHPCGGAAVLNCNDGQNGAETGPDCGGDPSACPTRCDEGVSCQEHADCLYQDCDTGICAPEQCGNGEVNGAEECDAMNQLSWDDDDCTATCRRPAPHLLISEFADEDDDHEFIEIYNPTADAVGLDDVYLSNRPSYYQDLTPGDYGNESFIVRFPGGAQIAGRSFLVIAMKSHSNFTSAWGVSADYAMSELVGGSGFKLDNDDGMLVLYRWAGAGELVEDIDYVVWTDTAAGTGTDKTGQTVDGKTYLPDTPTASQRVIGLVAKKDDAYYRCDPAEPNETESGGNGSHGHDETSEDMTAAWRVSKGTATPGMAPSDPGPCPP